MDTLKKRMKVDIRLGCIAVYPEDMKPSCLNNIGDHDDCIHRRRGTMVGGKYTINPKHVIVAQAVCDRWNGCAGIKNPAALAEAMQMFRELMKAVSHVTPAASEDIHMAHSRAYDALDALDGEEGPCQS